MRGDVSNDSDTNQFEPTPRDIDQVRAAVEEMLEKIWYDRHQLLVADAAERSVCPCCAGLGAGEARARELEEKYADDDLGPYDDFEWGMLNGKLSALRWVLGQEWDMLDT